MYHTILTRARTHTHTHTQTHSHTGYFDEDGCFYITDRLKELIKVKGFQVAPAELESLLVSHPNLADAAVVGIPNERLGEAPKAFVVKKDKDVTEKDVVEFVAGKVRDTGTNNSLSLQCIYSRTVLHHRLVESH